VKKTNKPNKSVERGGGSCLALGISSLKPVKFCGLPPAPCFSRLHLWPCQAVCGTIRQSGFIWQVGFIVCSNNGASSMS